MKAKVSLLFTLALLLPGCVPTSINPLYTPKDLIFDPALLGVWGEGDSKETWTFERPEKGGDKNYTLKHTDNDGRIGEFDAHLLKLSQQMFLDLHLSDYGGDDNFKGNMLANFAMIIRPGHLFLKVDQVGPVLQMRLISLETLETLLKKNPKAVRHERIMWGEEGRLVLTAKTRELQRFILKHMNDEKFFGNATELEKRPASKPVNP